MISFVRQKINPSYTPVDRSGSYTVMHDKRIGDGAIKGSSPSMGTCRLADVVICCTHCTMTDADAACVFSRPRQTKRFDRQRSVCNFRLTHSAKTFRRSNPTPKHIPPSALGSVGFRPTAAPCRASGSHDSCVFLCVDEKEFIINELASIIEDQSYRMPADLQDVQYSVSRDRTADGDPQAFTYDLASDLPRINTGDQQIPFAVLPNDRRYYRPGIPGGVVVTVLHSPLNSRPVDRQHGVCFSCMRLTQLIAPLPFRPYTGNSNTSSSSGGGSGNSNSSSSCSSRHSRQARRRIRVDDTSRSGSYPSNAFRQYSSRRLPP